MSDSEADLLALMRADRAVQNKRRAEQAAVDLDLKRPRSRGSAIESERVSHERLGGRASRR
jgi:hypothetical protein